MSNATVTQMPGANRAISILADTVPRFLRRDFAPTTRVAYGKTLAVLIEQLGADTPLARISTEVLEDVLAATWGHTSSKTYNRHLAAISSFFTWAVERGTVTHNPARIIESRKVRKLTEDAKRDRPISVALLAELWHLRDGPVFLANRLPWTPQPAADLDLSTDRRRLRCATKRASKAAVSRPLPRYQQ